MRWAALTVAPQVLASVAERRALAVGVRHLPVVDRGRLVGVLCTCDLRNARSHTLVAECMSAPVVATDELLPVETAAEIMVDSGIGCLPVVVDDRLIGIVTLGDLRRGGVPVAIPACAACGSLHHVRKLFCIECIEAVKPPAFPEYYVEVGGGD